MGKSIESLDQMEALLGPDPLSEAFAWKDLGSDFDIGGGGVESSAARCISCAI